MRVHQDLDSSRVSETSKPARRYGKGSESVSAEFVGVKEGLQIKTVGA